MVYILNITRDLPDITTFLIYTFILACVNKSIHNNRLSTRVL